MTLQFFTLFITFLVVLTPSLFQSLQQLHSILIRPLPSWSALSILHVVVYPLAFAQDDSLSTLESSTVLLLEEPPHVHRKLHYLSSANTL